MSSAAAGRSALAEAAWSCDLPERESPGGQLFDYCYWPYSPRAPLAGKLRSSNALFHSFEVAQAPALTTVCAAIREELGANRTVWGTKWDGQRLSWEFYFYDYARLDRQISLGRVLAVLGRFAHCDLVVDEHSPYFMFSLDIDRPFAPGGARPRIEQANLYLGNPDCTVSSGLSYALSAEGLAFDNLYYFFDAQREMQQVQEKLLCSLHLDLTRLRLDELLWPELRDCGSIVVANKRHCDGLYYSRITIDQLLAFLRRLAYPPALIDYLEANRRAMDHLLFDVGFDYSMRDGRIELRKSSYYGLF